MAERKTDSVTHTRFQSDVQHNHDSDVNKSHQRVRDWIKMTEDNMTSSGVSEGEDTFVNSQQEQTEVDASPDHDAHLQSSALHQESWDRFQTVSHDEQWGEEGVVTFMRGFKVVWMVTLFLVVLTAGVANKLAMLTLTSAIVKDAGGGESDPTPAMLLLAVCFPYLWHLLTYSARSLFGGTHWPSLRMTIVVLFLELSHTTGLCLLLFRVLPRVDMMRALVFLTSVYVAPSLLNVITRVTDRVTSAGRRVLMTCVAVLAFVLQAGSVGLATYQGFLYNGTEAERLGEAAESSLSDPDRGLGVDRSSLVVGQGHDLQLPVALFLISLGFWENFIDGEFRLCGFTLRVSVWKAYLGLVRQKLYVMVSIFKIGASIILAVVLVPNFAFTLTFPADPKASLTSNNPDDLHLERYGPLYTMIVSGVLCSYLSGLACKLCMQHLGFALPLSLVTPVSAVIVMLECHFSILNIPSSTFTWVCPDSPSGVTSWSALHVIMLAVTWLSQLLLTWHVWRPTSGRMEKIQKLFITPMRCAVLTEQTLMARRRIHYAKTYVQGLEGESILYSEESSARSENTPLVYACATMWHETRKEMVQLMKSIFRMDIDRSARFIAQKYYNVKDPEYYDFEAHIFFDDAMQMSEDGLHLPNDFVTSLMECLDDAVSAVHERPTSLGDPVRTPTPYGGRLTWVLPGGTPLVVHLKDKNKIRHKKRWSQVMYMYYLLGYKILANSEMTSDQEPEFDSVSGIMKKSEASGMTSRAKLTSSELRRRRTAAHFTRSVIFNYVPEEVHEQAENTYILALDGDVDFKPEAVRLLMDRMNKNKKVGAACGRIHPTGSGPMVWYQKFEYAIGHWLQKASEHVFGCVLCAPGCFTLFRGSALMDDNVARTYTTRSELAMHHVQYDQGEDRWLSTLLLQQGYRIDYCAASDALTHAPETFSEFFNQRRRWGPSTLANVVDLLGSWQSAVRLNDNLSSLYVSYQAMMLVSTVLGPATIILLMAGSFKIVFKISVLGSYALTLIVPALYVALCLYAKPRLQLTVGAGLSALYALVMAIVLVGTVGSAVLGSITSPNVLFLFTVILVFTVSAVLHPQEFYCILPGVLYLIMIPAGYLVLTIYSFCNLHVVSWGTRETHTVKTHAQIEKEKQEAEEKKAGKKGGILGWLGLHATLKEARHLVKQARAGLFRKEKRDKSKSFPEKTRTDQLLEELIVEIRKDRECRDSSRRKSTSALTRGEQSVETHHGDQAACGREDEAQSQLSHSGPSRRDDHERCSHLSHSGPSRRDDQERWSQHSQRPLSVHNQASSSLRSRASSVNDSDNESSDHEDRDTVVTNVNNHTVIHLDGNPPQLTTTQQPPRPPRHDDVTNPSWLTSEVCGEGPVTRLNERETAFWSQLIHKYLHPLNEDKAHRDKMQADLKSLRNSVVFGFVMVSVIWIALTMQLEALQDDLEMFIYIHIPRMTPGAPPLTFQPLGMFFLSSFAIVLLVQFAGMFAHRWGTLLHTLSITEIGVGNSNDQRKEVRDAILRVIQLQKLRNIDLEPNPDYDDTTPLPTPTINPLFVPDIGIAHDVNDHFTFVDRDVSKIRGVTLDDATRPVEGRAVGFIHPPAAPPVPHPSIPPPPSESGFHPSSTRSALHRSHSFRHEDLVDAHRPGDVRRELWEYDVSRGRKGPLGNFTLQRAFEKRFRNEIGSRLNQAGQASYSHGHVAQHFQPW